MILEVKEHKLWDVPFEVGFRKCHVNVAYEIKSKNLIS